ncbi:MAG: pyridoxamine 5'-phosphate oxidase [Puniceicoccaceae bacterium]
MDITHLREEYRREALNRETLKPEPMDQFKFWFDQCQEAQINEPNAMILATVCPDGAPLNRTVLLKKLDDRGFIFFTNYESSKARHIAGNSRVSALFLWLGLERQVIINGSAEKISNAESLAYFVTRPLGSRLGAWTSQQSSVIKSRSLLEAKLHEMKTKFADGKIPLPSFWGGYRIVPDSYEFWQGRQSRLHDRFRYTRSGDAWQVERLQP